MQDKKQIKISIRNLVEFVLRAGDLDNRFTGSSRAAEGTRIHQKIQKSYKKLYSKEADLINAAEEKISYSAEVPLKLITEYKEFTFNVEGRADGIIIKNDFVTIDEIKSTAKPLQEIEQDYNLLHWAQAQCYAYIYAFQNNLEEINVQLTYFQINTEEIKYFNKQFSLKELEQFFYDLLDKYLIWARFTSNWIEVRDNSIKEIEFPFKTYRKGQRQMAVAAYGTIKEGKKIFIQAPTGIGKTISTLFPSIKAMREGFTSKIFYLTAKTITRKAAEDALIKMKQCNLRFKSITLTAKDKICFNPDKGCNPNECEYARGHYDRVNEAILDILNNEDILHRKIIEGYAERYHICPFEFSLDLAIWADCVICDYNYVFDPRVYLKRFFEGTSNDFTLLIDEAHNLVDRAREMFSAEIDKKSFLNVKKIIKDKSKKVSRELNKINLYMLNLKKELHQGGNIDETAAELQGNIVIRNDKTVVIHESMDKLVFQLRRLNEIIEQFIAENKDKSEDFQELLDLYFQCSAFIRTSELYDERYVTIIQENDGNLRVKFFCVDPSYLLKETLKRVKSAIFFSATLTPIDYFRYILGGEEGDYILRLHSPFSIENRQVLMCTNISTKFRNRDKSIDEIVQIIHKCTSLKKGNYLVFFPSYKYMKDTCETYSNKYSDSKILLQEPDMGEEDREKFLQEFKEEPEETLIAFAVLGGIFSEGIDLKFDKLIGAIIIGVGLPQICTERDIIKNYFRDKNNMGYEYSYIYPGMNKVLQAGGRVIRTEEDKGIILLIDERYNTNTYKKLLPMEWFPNYTVGNIKALTNCLNDFWGNNH
ncbi:ATP-dependent DNA helicase [Clostridium sp. JN-9]|uniref:ATP-dependent DNA helicase n=1 Tax=Clostridium sp. JN-9 TaxID=2507159 RepID=UPI000FFE1C36|nr:ATP-dependent DNA helicase [Clostridium sp. JN-9]QAT40888.1 ATP-dependent DNA helicase [Clostridium sp. JN-9]